jgi:hypothetical protein
MECAVNPIQHEIRADEENRRLQPKRQHGKRSVPIVIEFDESLRAGDAKESRGTEHKKADAQIAREQRDKEPLAKIVDSSRLRHHGRPGLQAQRKVRSVKAASSAIDTGTILTNVTPTLCRTAIASSNMAVVRSRWTMQLGISDLALIPTVSGGRTFADQV